MPDSDPPLVETLSPRERDFLRLLAEDCSNAEIGERLVLSTGTVRWYVKQVYAKLGVHSREEAVERANAVLQAPTPPPHNLPTPPTPFVGRERELADLAHILSDHDVRLVTVLSPGGMGKTRLAIELAERQLYTFQDGVFFVPLQALSAPDHLLTAIADAVNYRFEESPRSPLQQLSAFLRPKALLLVLDNIEHLLDAAPLVSELLAAAPGVTCLVTSRERLNLRGEAVYALDGLDYPTEDAADLTANAAFALFMHSAQYARPGFSPDERDAAAIADICRLVDGMPLALELAARWMDMLSPAEIAAEIRCDLDFLSSEGRDVPARQHSMRVIFGAAWKRLNEAERDAFQRFAMFRGGCTRDAAQAVTGASLRTLAGLVDKGLLRLGASGRYRVHELLRQFAEEQLGAANTTDAARAAHSAYYVDLLRRLEPAIKGARFFETQAELAADLENLRAACLWAAAQADLEPLAAGIMTLGVFFASWSGRWFVGAAFLNGLATVLRQRPPSPVRDAILAEVLAWQVLTGSTMRRVDTAAVDALLQEGAALTASGGTTRARIVVEVAWADARISTFTQAAKTANQESAQHLERALALLESHPDPFLQAIVQRYVGRIAWTGGALVDLHRARQYLDQALQTAQETGNPYLIARAMIVRATVVGYSDYTEGKRAARECVAYCRRTGQRRLLAGVLNALGVLYLEYFAPRESARAATCWRAARTLFASVGDNAGVQMVVGNLAAFMELRGDFAAARQYRSEQRSLLIASENASELVDDLAVLARLGLWEGKYAEAEAWMAQALEAVRSFPHLRPDDTADTRYIAADLALVQGQFEVAEQHVAEGLAAARTMDDAARIAAGLRLQGTLAFARGDVQHARETLKQVIRHIVEIRATVFHSRGLLLGFELARTCNVLSQIERQLGNTAASRALIVEVLKAGQSLLCDSLLLMGLLQVAYHVEPSKAIELAALVHAHRRSYGFSREQAAQLLETLKDKLPAETFAAAVKRGKALDVAQTAEKALEWLERREK